MPSARAQGRLQRVTAYRCDVVLRGTPWAGMPAPFFPMADGHKPGWLPRALGRSWGAGSNDNLAVRGLDSFNPLREQASSIRKLSGCQVMFAQATARLVANSSAATGDGTAFSPSWHSRKG
jgi:hypothetical protein